jgi:hypothetical protein
MESKHPTVKERRKYREAPAPHFRRLADTWTGLLGVQITPEQACLMLAVLKIVREFAHHEPDNMPDCEGYISMIEEIREE